jgi:hypothetical protein
MFIFDYPVVYYKSRKRELKMRLMNDSRCDQRLKARVQEAICLTYTGLVCLFVVYLQQKRPTVERIFFCFFSFPGNRK